MHYVWLAIGFQVFFCFLFFILIRRVKKIPLDWSVINNEEILYEESRASGCLLSNGLRGAGGASGVLTIRISKQYLILGAQRMAKYFGGSLFGSCQIIPRKDIHTVHIDNTHCIVQFTVDGDEHVYKLRSKDPEQICRELGFIEQKAST